MSVSLFYEEAERRSLLLLPLTHSIIRFVPGPPVEERNGTSAATLTRALCMETGDDTRQPIITNEIGTPDPN